MATDSERLARLEGIVGEHSQRISDMDARHIAEFTVLRQDIASLRESVETLSRHVDNRIWGLVALIGTMWVTVILAILFAP